MKKTIILIMMATLMQGCVAALIGGGAYHASKTKKARQEWNSSFQKTNMERESRGLQPLDWCDEAAKFDRSMANKDPVCKQRLAFRDEELGIKKTAPRHRR